MKRTCHINRMTRYQQPPLDIALDDLEFVYAMKRAAVRHWQLRSLQRDAERVVEMEAERRN